MKNRMGVMLSFNKFKKRYLRRSIVVLGVHLLGSILKIMNEIVSSEPLKINQLSIKELLTQIRYLDFHISGKGFITINRQILARVKFEYEQPFSNSTFSLTRRFFPFKQQPPVALISTFLFSF